MNQFDEIVTNRKKISSRQENLDYLKKMYYRILSHWYLILSFLLMSLAIAFFYSSFSLPTYRITSTILINEKKERSLTSKNQILEGFSLGDVMQNLDNQIMVLKSKTLLKRALDELPFQVQCYRRNFISKVFLYPDNPIRIIPEKRDSVPFNTEFTFVFNDNNSFNIKARSKGPGNSKPFTLDARSSFGELIKTPYGSFTIFPSWDNWPTKELGKKIHFMFSSKEKLVEDYSRRLKVEAASRTGTTVILSIEATNRTKEIEFLNKITEIFLINSLDKKNQEAIRTIQFIDDQLIGISDSLVITENRLQQFRSQNRVMNLSIQGQSIIEQAMNLENEKARLGIEANYYKYLADYLAKDNAGQAPIAPATMGITDPGLTKLVADLSELQDQYYSRRLGERNPLQNQLAQRVSNTKEALRETLDGIIRANNIALNENQEQIRTINAQASALPVTERQLLGIERKYKLNDELYTFLLEKRADAQIQKASNIPDNELIDPPATTYKPVKPKKILAYMIAILAGIGLPLLWIVISDTNNDKIIETKDIQSITELPVYSSIPHSSLIRNFVLTEDPASAAADGFRSLRNKILLLSKNIPCPVILITSPLPSEGRTFVAMNLASSICLTGKKTLIIDLDLRNKEKDTQKEFYSNRGISTWLRGEDQLTNIIKRTSLENLFFISSGPFASNSSELIVSEKTNELFSNLKGDFEYIIIDSSPLGLLADSMYLAAYSDISLLLIKQNETSIQFLEKSIKELKISNTKNIGLVFNDLRMKEKILKNGGRFTYPET